ncbi:MAG: nuclease [Desulfobacterales bacterium]|nr:MAG: nuclease [Desulfobacterales bacterium]
MCRDIIQLVAVLIVSCTILLPAQQARAELYTWTDAKGVRHYSNISPPAAVTVRRIEEKQQKRLPSGTRFKVINVFDGDTIQAKGANLVFKVRLVGIDAPEKGRKGQPGQPFAQKSKQVLEKLIGGKKVRIKQYGTGGYNRVLAELFVNNQNINLTMIEQGLAEVYRGKSAQGLNKGRYKRAEKTAKAKRIGIWSLGRRYKSPKRWRKENPWK